MKVPEKKAGRSDAAIHLTRDTDATHAAGGVYRQGKNTTLLREYYHGLKNKNE